MICRTLTSLQLLVSQVLMQLVSNHNKRCRNPTRHKSLTQQAWSTHCTAVSISDCTGSVNLARWCMSADHYGPAEVLIGRYLKQNPELRNNLQVGRLSLMFVFFKTFLVAQWSSHSVPAEYGCNTSSTMRGDRALCIVVSHRMLGP